MTKGASPSILGLQHNRRLSSSTEVPSAPAGATVAAAKEAPLPDETPGNLPTITLDPGSAYAPMQMYGQQPPPMRLSPQLDPYHHYGGMPQHFQPHDLYYMHANLPYPPAAGLAPPPPPHPFMRAQSPNGPYIGPQRLGSGLMRGDSERSNSLDWATPGYTDAGSGFPGNRLQTPPAPRPPLPPKPIVPTATGVPPLAISELPDPTVPKPSAVTGHTPPDPQAPLETQPDHHEVPPVTEPLDEARESLDEPPAASQNPTQRMGACPTPPAVEPQDEASESPPHAPQNEPPAGSPKPTRGMGGRPTVKALQLIEQGFTKITTIIEGLAEATGKPPSDLYRRLEKSRKGSSDGHLWNIYLHYFARHEDEEAARIGRPLERTQPFRSLCYVRYKRDHENFQELLETYQELEMADTEMTVGQRKREVEKYEKKLRDMVSNQSPSVRTWTESCCYRQWKPIGHSISIPFL